MGFETVSVGAQETRNPERDVSISILAALAICTLLLKTGQQRASFDVEYVGFEIAPHFVVGYGLDVAERYRNLADLRVYVGGEPE